MQQLFTHADYARLPEGYLAQLVHPDLVVLRRAPPLTQSDVGIPLLAIEILQARETARLTSRTPCPASP